MLFKQLINNSFIASVLINCILLIKCQFFKKARHYGARVVIFKLLSTGRQKVQKKKKDIQQKSR